MMLMIVLTEAVTSNGPPVCYIVVSIFCALFFITAGIAIHFWCV